MLENLNMLKIQEKVASRHEKEKHEWTARQRIFLLVFIFCKRSRRDLTKLLAAQLRVPKSTASLVFSNLLPLLPPTHQTPHCLSASLGCCRISLRGCRSSRILNRIFTYRCSKRYIQQLH